MSTINLEHKQLGEAELETSLISPRLHIRFRKLSVYIIDASTHNATTLCAAFHLSTTPVALAQKLSCATIKTMRTHRNDTLGPCMKVQKQSADSTFISYLIRFPSLVTNLTNKEQKSLQIIQKKNMERKKEHNEMVGDLCLVASSIPLQSAVSSSVVQPARPCATSIGHVQGLINQNHLPDFSATAP